MTNLKTLLVAALLATTAFSGARAADATTTTTYRSTTYTQNYYNFNPFSKDTLGLYVAAQAGGSFPSSKLDDSGVYGLTVGWQFHPMVRAEIEGAYRNNDVDSAGGDDADTYTAMLNGYFDFKNDTRFTPYVGVGAGWAWSRRTNAVDAESENNFAYQGIVGVSYMVDTNWALTADYRYVDTFNFDYSANDADYNAHEVRAGVRYTF